MARFKKVSADEARAKVAKREGAVRSTDRGDVVMKGFRAPPSWNGQNRSARFTMSSESVDRYGDIIVQSGLDTTRFMENPVGLIFHNSRSWPCGVWSDVSKVLNGRPKRTEGTLAFLPEGTDEDADRAARHVAAGSIRTVSIGFQPDWDQMELILDDDEEWVTGFRFNASELLECSVVPIPAQPDALVKSAGGMALAKDVIEDILDNWAKTDAGVLVPMEEYRAKHLDIVGERSFHVVKALLPPAPKTVEVEARRLKAATDDEARTFIGAIVRLDPAHPENEEMKDHPFMECDGEVFDSWIVDHGEFKGVHALAVEFSTKAGEAIGMYRGLKAERVFLAKAVATPADTEPRDTDPDEPAEEDAVVEELDAATDKEFEEFLAKIEAGDEVRTYSKLVDGKFLEIGFSLLKAGTNVVHPFETEDGITAEQRKAVEARMAEVGEVREPEVKPIVLKIDTAELDAAEARVTAFGKLVDSVGERLASLFKRSAPPERVEPTIEKTVDEPPAPPDQATVDAVMARAAAAKARLQELVS